MPNTTDHREYDQSRRRFLRQATLLGAGAMAAPLLLTATPAQAGLFDAPSPDQQKQLGDKAALDILKQYKEVFDGRAKHFNELGQRLVHALPIQDQRTWNYKFHVLDSKDVNAFALPGGNMFMFTGLYEKLTSDDALAGVTGHEMTHVRLQHWAKAYAKQQKRDLLIGGLLGIFHASSSVQSIAGIADQTLFTLPFSRTEEDQADAGGLQNMVAAGYNPQGMIDLFQTLNKVSGGGSMPAFLSDHPLTNDRIKHTQQRIAALQGRYRFPAETALNYKSL